MRTPSKADDAYTDFMEAVRPFHRVVYLVAFACTKDRAVAELIAVEAISAASKPWKCQRPGAEELELHLIRIALSEAWRYVDNRAASTVEDIRKDIGDLVISQTSKGWCPVSSDNIPDDVVRSSLVRAIEELPAVTAITLLLRDAFHLSPLQIAGLIGESQRKVQERLAYGRIALCIRLAEAASDRGHGRRQRRIAAY